MKNFPTKRIAWAVLYFFGFAVLCFAYECSRRVINGPDQPVKVPEYAYKSPQVDSIGGRAYYRAETQQIEDQAAIKALVDSLNYYRRVSASVSARVEIRYKYIRIPAPAGRVVQIPPVDTVPGPPSNCLLLPTRFQTRDSLFALAVTIDSAGLLVDSLKVETRPTVTFGQPRRTGFGLLRAPSVFVTYTDGNPNVRVTGIRSAIYTPRRKWYERPWVTGLIGLGAGYLIFK